MKTALLCGKWPLVFRTEPKAELDRPKTKRSYLHYVAAHQELVAAKCLATEWLFTGATITTVAEYFAGVGIMATILRGLFHPPVHYLADIDAECVEQLSAAFPDLQPKNSDACYAMLEPRPVELQVLDFHSFTILHGMRKWASQLEAIFRTKPSHVMITDTAASYLPATKSVYTRVTGWPIASIEDYSEALSSWLHKSYGYRITKAAHRGRNAVYCLAQPGAPATIEHAYFPTAGSSHGFVYQ